ncbi:MAG: hypothetical protein EB828_04815 [Nitrosopumilus sp. D6]|nr:MAG: hypothetical protein EB828_04815 [Nitrosopumilus sp. D6]
MYARYCLKLPLVVGFLPAWLSHSAILGSGGIQVPVALVAFQCACLWLAGTGYRKLPLFFAFAMILVHRHSIENHVMAYHAGAGQAVQIMLIAFFCACMGFFGVWFVDWVRHGRRWMTLVTIILYSFYPSILIRIVMNPT